MKSIFIGVFFGIVMSIPIMLFIGIPSYIVYTLICGEIVVLSATIILVYYIQIYKG